MVEVNVSTSSRYMAALGVDTRFVLPDISMPSCSVEDSWSKPVRRLLRNPEAPFYRHPITQLPATYLTQQNPPLQVAEEEEEEERERLSPLHSCAGSDSASSILQPCGEHSEEDSGRGTCASSGAPYCDVECDLSDVDEAEEPHIDDEQPCEWSGGCVVEPMTDSELDYVERAHRNSKFLEVYSEPSLRFVTVPPYSFVLPRIIGKHLKLNYIQHYLT
ncbi:unnamed protein product [Strongylus vulgaris]|uniref:Uncharacterized protein n=1 Tax=Strongylus vulgaris TaxID=40348 RepID=A0A3P7KU16_STRVU|nr:unnamed protein product [Strongylus vulgaris]